MKKHQNKYLLNKRLEFLNYAKTHIANNGLKQSTFKDISNKYKPNLNETELLFPEGIIGIINSPRNGNISSSFPVFSGDEILISTNKGRVIRVAVKEIRTAGRNTQGVRIIKLSGEEKVVSANKIDDNLL